MGDRRNIEFKYARGTSLFLYSHSYGTELPLMLALALRDSRARWYDEGYLSRMLITHIVDQADATREEYGWGMTPVPYITGDGHPDITVDLTNQTVTIKKTRTYEEFVEDKR